MSSHESNNDPDLIQYQPAESSGADTQSTSCAETDGVDEDDDSDGDHSDSDSHDIPLCRPQPDFIAHDDRNVPFTPVAVPR